MSIEPNPGSGIKTNKIEQKEFIFPSDIDPFFEGFFDEIKSGKFRLRTEEDVEKDVSLETSLPPITPLTDEELVKLKERIRKHAEFGKKKMNSDLRFYVEDPTCQDTAKRLIAALETYNEQEDFYELNKLWNFVRSGSRHLYSADISEPTYFYKDRKEFEDKIGRIKNRTCKSILTMLDIGGNVGKALVDAKKVDSTLRTLNMTLEFVPVTQGDIVVRRPAEYMPAVFEEKMDLIESNFAFRYFLFPDIALKNAVKALSVGGEANIEFVNDNCPLGEEEILKRMQEIFSWLKELEEKGFIEVSKSLWFKIRNERGQVEFQRRSFDPFVVNRAIFGRQLQIVKKKSTIGL